jgi:ubiquinone/menaquinone biosynthesis C-methylase UbiE
VYKECRAYASTGDAWAEPFLNADASWLRTLTRLALVLDPRWKAIARNVPPGGRILDAGCGLSPWPAFLTSKGYEAAGLDFSDRMIAALRTRYPKLEWIVGTVQSIPFPSESFDAVISWGVIEHDEAGPDQALREFLRILRPGGRLILTVPIDSPSQRHASDAQFKGPDARIFFQYFMTPEEFGRAVTQVGFRLVEPIHPVSRHHAFAFPRFYRRLERYPAVVGRLVGWTLKPAMLLRPDSTNMIMAVAEKP